MANPLHREASPRLAQGVDYNAGFQTHAGTETCPGHSTLLTGKHPNKTGIVANTYRDPDTGKMKSIASTTPAS